MLTGNFQNIVPEVKKIIHFIFEFIKYIFIPRKIYEWQLNKLTEKLAIREDKEYILERVNYYNKLSASFYIQTTEFSKTGKLPVKDKRYGYMLGYFFDSVNILHYFSKMLQWNYVFGDISTEMPYPTIVKSRPISLANQNNVLLKLNSFRHFLFLHDKRTFMEKLPKAIFRADIGEKNKQNRVEFMKTWFGSEICNCGSIRNMPDLPKEWLMPKLSIAEHLKFRYILALEGNDVASNLKWIMSSNSVAVMPKPTCETWFMEGTLIPDYHYIEIKPDFTDLEERLRYFNENPEKAEKIIKNAHEYIEQFKDKKREKLIGLKVMEKYFTLSGQKI